MFFLGDWRLEIGGWRLGENLLKLAIRKGMNVGYL